MPVCPFRIGPAMLLEGQRARIHAVGEGKQAPIDTSCVGPECMAFTVTGAQENGTPVGGCGLATGPIFLKGVLVPEIGLLNAKVDALVLAVAEALGEWSKAGERGLAERIKALYTRPSTPGERPALTAIEGGHGDNL